MDDTNETALEAMANIAQDAAMQATADILSAELLNEQLLDTLRKIVAVAGNVLDEESPTELGAVWQLAFDALAKAEAR